MRALRQLDKAILFILVALVFPVTAEEKGEDKKPGQTIFAADKRTSLKVMRDISKSLGVKCTHCHVKEGNKVKYEIDTPNKKNARAMKFGFVDRLGSKRESAVEYTHDGKAATVRAVVHAEGAEPGIYLSRLEKGKTTAEKRVELPAKGEILNCNTCHMGAVHIFEHAGETH